MVLLLCSTTGSNPAWPAVYQVGGDTCDPSRATCVAAPGSSGIGSASNASNASNASSSSSSGGSGGMCTAPPGGNPSCSGSGPASSGATGPSSGAGNPINLLNGNKYQEETDLAPLPGVLGLELKRYYNSQSSHAGLLGANWRMSYETVLYDFGHEIQIVQADGRRLMFQRGLGAAAALCTSAQPQDGQVRIEASRDGRAGPTYHWRWADGRTLTFSSGSGGGYPLQSIAAATGERVTLSYAPGGELTGIRDPQGRKLAFVYAGATAAERRGRFLKAIDTPLGRIGYTQDSLGRLTEVSQARDARSAPFVTRLYHYEDRYNAGHKTALTGISVKGLDPQTKQNVEQRLSTYAYNSQGLAVLSTKGVPREKKDGKQVEGTGIEQVEVEYLEKALPRQEKVGRRSAEALPAQFGRAILVNSLGQKTQVTSAVIGGHFRLIEMRGPGCSTCGPANMQYGYDANGVLARTTRLDDNGMPMHDEVTEFDAYGRTLRVGTRVYADRKPQPLRWTERYEYADVSFPDGSVALAPRPSLVARPSVIAGREHTTAFRYDPAGQLVEVSEAGFSPLDESGMPSSAGSAIRRSTRYTYQTVNGRSVLRSIDGPLANGPKASPEDSDIIQLTWDADGARVVRVDYPAGVSALFQYDDATGAVSTFESPAGFVDQYRYGPQLQLIASTRSRAGQVVGGASYRYDLLGRLIEVARLVGGQPLPEMLRNFDVADRLLWQADRRGVLRRASYDTEDHLLRSQVLGGGVQQEERYGYDVAGRLTRVDDSTGATRRLMRDASGRIAATVDPLGRVTEYLQPQTDGTRAVDVVHAANTGKPLAVRYSFDTGGRPSEIAATASDGGSGVRKVATRLLTDDFGREVGVISPDSGAVYTRYDEADQPTQVRDATGNVIDTVYDPAGRLVTRTVRSSSKAAEAAPEPDTTRYFYQGTRLVGIENAQQTEHYTYDDRARLVGKRIRLPLAGDKVATVEERYRYDAEGHLIARSLPDGSELQFDRNDLGQIARISRQTSVWTPFGWGRTTLASDFEADLIGLKKVTYGNGVVGRWQRSREGVLARVVYTSPVPTKNAWRVAFERLIPQAHAEVALAANPATDSSNSGAPEQSVGALGLASDPRALWDGRLLYDMAGNVRVQGQFAHSGVAEPTQTRYLYDGLDQLAQAMRIGTAHADSRAVAASASNSAGVGVATVWRYHADSLGNRLLAQQEQPGSEMGQTLREVYAEEPVGNRLGAVPMDAAGRPLVERDRHYVWDAQGRLAEVSQPGKPAAHYGYDARGLRVSKQVGAERTYYLYDERRQRTAELDAQGRVLRHYIWLGTQLLAVIDAGEPRAVRPAPIDRLGLVAQGVAAIWREGASRADAVVYVHANHLGAPVAMTDANARPVWGSQYSPFGQRRAIESTRTGPAEHVRPVSTGAAGVPMDLRLPGQWEDQETGLHYNDQRYFDPQTGRYLNPDPAGLRGGLNAYAYAANNPIGFVDPLGLLLFAFDGTNNDASNPEILSNVYKLKELYNSGDSYYITGVGTPDPTTGIHNPWYKGDNLLDAGLALTGKERISAMIKNLDAYSDKVDDNASFNIDVIGFSRGAAEARDFSNQVASHFDHGYYRYTEGKGEAHCQKVSLNFMGLFDTVLSHHVGSYQLAIPAAFKYVAQAAALNEYRDGLFNTFPAESILGVSAPTDTVRIEKGFLGSHSDIGGGFEQGDLAKVAMVWMANQAKLAGIQLSREPSLEIIANPVLHDKSTNLRLGGPNATSEDRDVRFADGSVGKQRSTVNQVMTYADTTKFIKYLETPDLDKEIAATVDARGYIDWLNENGYGLTNLIVN